MNVISMRRQLVVGITFLTLTLVISLRATPVVSQGPSNHSRFEYRVIEVPPDTRSNQAGLDEYGLVCGSWQHSKWVICKSEGACPRAIHV